MVHCRLSQARGVYSARMQVCMQLLRLAGLSSLVFPVLLGPIIAQDLPAQPKAGAKVCVAIVANASTTQAIVERLTDRLTASLKQNEIDAITIDSSTSDSYPLQLSKDNGAEVKQNYNSFTYLSRSFISNCERLPTLP